MPIPGSNEQRCIIRDVLGLYGYIAATATYEGPSLPGNSTLYEVLKRCIDQHPVLSTVILAAESKKPQLARAHIMDLDKHLRYSKLSDEHEHSISSLHDRLLEVHNEPPTEYESIPQWRVWVFPIRQNSSSKTTLQVTFACSHSLADGMSLYVFHQSFLRALSEMPKVGTSTSAIYEVKSESELLPALEHVTKMPISWSLLIPRFFAEYSPPFLAKILGLNEEDGEDVWCGAGKRPDAPAQGELLTTALEILLVPNSTLQRVLKVCRANDGRLTALLDHLTTRALGEALKKRDKSYATFGIEISINLRKVIPQGENQIANYPSAIEQKHDISANPDPAAQLSSADWDTIRRNTAQLAKISNTLKDQPIALLKYVTDFRQLVQKRVSNPTNTAFGMSNLGVFVDNRASEQGWRMTEVVFSQSADGTSAICNINVANVQDGPLAITLTWWPGMLGVDDEESFAQDVLKAIESQLERLS